MAVIVDRTRKNTILLVVTGRKGTFTVQDADGEEEAKEVSIDPVNQSMRIGDEPYRYRSKEISCRQKIWSKQRMIKGLLS